MTPTTILAGLLVFAFAALGSAKLAAVPAVPAEPAIPAMRAIAPTVVLGLVTLSFLLLVVGGLQ